MDGGQVALIGFLYQMIGALALRAWAECSDQIQGSDFEALLSIIREGDVWHEMGDIDALISRLGLGLPCAYVLLQFKYSQHPERYPITPGDLAEICTSFLRSTQQWTYQQRSITSYRVITNRPVSPTLQPIMDTPGKQRNHSAFHSPELKELLQLTEIISDVDFSTWMNALEHFASEYGVEKEEFETGIHRLIGELVRRASARQVGAIQKEDLAKAFRGYEDPHKLTIAAIRSYTKDHWNMLKDRLGLQGMPVRRKLLDEARDEMRKHALIIISGHGGSGKSVVAWDLLHAMLEKTAEPSGSVTVFLPIWDVQPHPLSWVIGEWAGVPVQHRTEHIEQAIRRLRIANPNAQQVFCLGLDGLDEQYETQDRVTSIREVIDWFWRQEQALQRRFQAGSVDPPEATLIVTCREYDAVIIDWLGGALSQEMRTYRLGSVSVTDFTSTELLLAVEKVMPTSVGRFEQTMTQRSKTNSIMSTSVMGTVSSPVSQETMTALCHPAMWFALQRLPTEKQYSLLDSDAHALDLLAEQFLIWFFEKIRRRWPNWNRDDVSEALEAVALHTSKMHAAQFSYTVWKEIGNRPHGLEQNKVRRLYEEALSAGLIREVERRTIWDWRHPFVGRYLAQKAEE